jgi:hypothetical protein
MTDGELRSYCYKRLEEIQKEIEIYSKAPVEQPKKITLLGARQEIKILLDYLNKEGVE